AVAQLVDAAHPPFAQFGDDLEPAVDLGKDAHLRWKRKSTPSWKADCSGAKVGTAELTRSSEVSALTTSRCTREAGTTPFCFFSASMSAAVKRELWPDGSSAPEDNASRARRCLVVSTYFAHCAALMFCGSGCGAPRVMSPTYEASARTRMCRAGMSARRSLTS